jgi:hypothetical protein
VVPTVVVAFMTLVMIFPALAVVLEGVEGLPDILFDALERRAFRRRRRWVYRVA